MVLIMAQSLHHDGVIAQSACGYAPPSPHVYKHPGGRPLLLSLASWSLGQVSSPVVVVDSVQY
jgi:hypothetical protein